MAKIDWARASGGTVKNGDKLLKELGAGRQAAFDTLAGASVGKPFAAVLAPHLVPLADKPVALRLIASIADALDARDKRGTKRVTDALKPVVARLPALVAHSDAKVRAAAAVLAGGLGERTGLKAALTAETDVRAKVCQLTALGDAKVAKAYVADDDLAVATAAAIVVKTGPNDTLVRAIGDASLEGMPWPGRSLRAVAARTLLARTFPKKLKGAPTATQLEVLRALFAVDGGAKLVMDEAWELGLPNRIETVRRIAGIPEPVPEGWVLATEVTVGGKRDSAYGHWIRYMATGEGDANALVDAIADALDAKECAQALVEAMTANYANRFEGEIAPPPLPKGGKLGAKKGWETWTVYKEQREDAVAETYAQQLVTAGWKIVGRCYDPGDALNLPDARIKAFRDGLELEGTFYREGKAGASVSVDVSPELFPLLVEAAYERHGKGFSVALVALPKLKLEGNVGYWLPSAALALAQRTKTVPDVAFDELVIDHQASANVLLPAHIAYIDLLPVPRRDDVVASILAQAEGKHRSLARMYPSDKVLAAAAEGLGGTFNSYSTYDDARRKMAAQVWAFVGDHAVPVIEKALAKKAVGNPDLAAQILVEIGTPAAKKALGKLTKHSDATVKKIAKAAIA